MLVKKNVSTGSAIGRLNIFVLKLNAMGLFKASIYFSTLRFVLKSWFRYFSENNYTTSIKLWKSLSKHTERI